LEYFSEMPFLGSIGGSILPLATSTITPGAVCKRHSNRLDDLGEVRKRASEPVNLVDNDRVDFARCDIVQ